MNQGFDSHASLDAWRRTIGKTNTTNYDENSPGGIRGEPTNGCCDLPLDRVAQTCQDLDARPSHRSRFGVFEKGL